MAKSGEPLWVPVPVQKRMTRRVLRAMKIPGFWRM